MNQKRQFKIALIQMPVVASKQENLAVARKKTAEAVSNGAEMVVLPEMFNGPPGHQYFAHYAEPVPAGETTQFLAGVAREYRIYLVGGSIPESDAESGGKIYNTSVVFDRKGGIIAKHRKVHLFDIDVPGKMTFKESDSLSPGTKPSVFETEFCRVGLGICYDVRFNELANLYSRAGARLLVYPAAFNMTTGPAHWQLLARARAVDTQCFVAMCAPARDTSASYVAWGHSIVVDPWGTIIAEADEKEATIYADIGTEKANYEEDLAVTLGVNGIQRMGTAVFLLHICADLKQADSIREMIPVLRQRRNDVYETIAQRPISVNDSS